MKIQKQFAWVFALLLVALTATAMGCAKSPELADTKPAGPTSVQPPPGAAVSGRSGETVVAERPAIRESTTDPSAGGRGTTGPSTGTTSTGVRGGGGPLQSVYFDYDKALLTDEAKRTLNENAVWLKANAQARIVVEGHCDERGTSEYNLALGDRRAKATRDYLVATGVDGNRLRTISYGKERPLDPGHDESAWRVNRRAQFTIAQ